MNKKLKITLALGVATLLFTGCGGGSDTTTPPTSEGVTISGTLDTGLAASVVGIERGIFGSHTKMVVLTNGGNTNKTYDVATDGSFSIPTSEITGNDMVILAVDDETKEVYGNLKLSTTTDDKLDFVDKSKLASSLNFGTIDSSLNTNQTIANSNAFSSADVTTLQTVARADDALVLAQNKYRNPTFDTEVFARFDMNISDSINQFNSFDDFNKSNNHEGNNFGFYKDGLDWQNSSIKIYPPSDVYYGNNFSTVANATTPMLSSGMTLLDDNGDGTDEGIFFDFPYVKDFPQGDWIVKIDNNDTAQAIFKFVGAEPFDTDGKIKVPVPALRINTDLNNVITTINVKWYLYKDGEYVEASEEILNLIASGNMDGFVQMEISDSNNNQKFYYRNQTENVDVWNETYTLETNTNISAVNQIVVSFPIGQVNHKFFFRN